MKIRYIALILCVCMLCSVFAACGGGQGETTTAPEGSGDKVETTEKQGREEPSDVKETEAGGETAENSGSCGESETAGTYETESKGGSESTEQTDEQTDGQTTEKITEETTEKETEEMITDVMTGEILDAPYALNFSVSRVFADHMVVQRGEHIRVWGFADESQNGKKV